MSRTRSAAGLLAWLAALGVGTWAFHALGEPVLPAPPWRAGEFSSWVAATEPTVVTMALLRLLVLALSWYLVGVTAVGGLARLVGAVRLVRLADLVTVPSVRRLLQSALGLGLATAMAAGATPARAQPLPLQLLETAEPDEPAMSTGEQSAGTVAAKPAEAVAEQHSEPGPRRDEHTVVAGESFWRIAAARLEQSRDAAPSDADVVVYWRRLIEHNRDRLADPGNPDLLFPGQRLVLPAVE